MRLHELKIWPEHFGAIDEGRKRFEIRRTHDRDFRVGDLLLLKEWDLATETYRGRTLLVSVTYIIPGREIPGGQVNVTSAILGFVVIRPMEPRLQETRASAPVPVPATVDERDLVVGPSR